MTTTSYLVKLFLTIIKPKIYVQFKVPGSQCFRNFCLWASITASLVMLMRKTWRNIVDQQSMDKMKFQNVEIPEGGQNNPIFTLKAIQ